MDPETLPPDYKYAKKKYITEDTCGCLSVYKSSTIFLPRRDGEAAAERYHVDQIGYEKFVSYP